MTRDVYYHVDRLEKKFPEGWTRGQFEQELKSDGYGPKARAYWFKMVMQDNTIAHLLQDNGRYLCNDQSEALYARC